MTNTGQYVVGLVVIVAIAAVDKYLIIESQSDSAVTDMVWIDGADFAASSTDNFTDRDISQDFQRAGFWIDGGVVGEQDYQQFLDASGYVGAANVKPVMMLLNNSSPHPPRMEQVFTLHTESKRNLDERSNKYINKTDALAYCNWKGLNLSSTEQHLYVSLQNEGLVYSPDITLHASHPLSDLSGFRCVKLPD